MFFISLFAAEIHCSINHSSCSPVRAEDGLLPREGGLSFGGGGRGPDRPGGGAGARLARRNKILIDVSTIQYL